MGKWELQVQLTVTSASLKRAPLRDPNKSERWPGNYRLSTHPHYAKRFGEAAVAACHHASDRIC